MDLFGTKTIARLEKEQAELYEANFELHDELVKRRRQINELDGEVYELQGRLNLILRAASSDFAVDTLDIDGKPASIPAQDVRFDSPSLHG